MKRIPDSLGFTPFKLDDNISIRGTRVNWNVKLRREVEVALQPPPDSPPDSPPLQTDYDNPLNPSPGTVSTWQEVRLKTKDYLF